MQSACSRPTWLTVLWGVCLTLSVLLSSRSAHATPTSEAMASTLTVLSWMSTASTPDEIVSHDVPAVSDERATERLVEPPVVPTWLVGFCDARGATAIAPLPALPASDGVVAADDSCSESTLRAGASIERRETPAQAQTGEAIDPAVLTQLIWMPRRGEPRVLPRPVDDRTALPSGFARGIDEPPRG